MLIETVKNKYGNDVVVCCASCRHNLGALSDRARACGNGQGAMKPSSFCKHWEMRPALDNAGKGDGKIKKKEYLDFFLEHPKTIEGVRIPIDFIREEYEKKNGTIYTNI